MQLWGGGGGRGAAQWFQVKGEFIKNGCRQGPSGCLGIMYYYAESCAHVGKPLTNPER